MVCRYGIAVNDGKFNLPRDFEREIVKMSRGKVDKKYENNPQNAPIFAFYSKYYLP
jgi:hypothetical protein